MNARDVALWHIAAPDVCDGTSAVGENRHRIPGASVGQPTEPCLAVRRVRKRRVAAASGIGGGEAVRAEWATMVANNATSAAAKFSVSALWPCQ